MVSCFLSYRLVSAYSLVPQLPCKSAIQKLNLNETLFYLGAEISEPAPNVFYLSCKSHSRMFYSFLRPQESYEGIFFRDRTFSLAEYKAWYRKNVGRQGKFTYTSDWGGFNIPSQILEPFESGHFGELSRLELLMLRLKHFLGPKFYLIATPQGTTSSMEHEISHGLWATNPIYRSEAEKILASVDLTDIYHKLKNSGGYHPAVYDDEAAAYLATGLRGLFMDEELTAAEKKYAKARQKMRKLLDQFLN